MPSPTDYRPPICPTCGYTLDGLPSQGACPECGTPYGAGNIIIFGWGDDAVSARSPIPMVIILSILLLLTLMPGIIILATAFVFGYGLSIVPAALVRMSGKFWVYSGVPSILWLTLGVNLWLRRRRCLRKMPAPVQIRMSPEGYAIRIGLGPAKIRPWRRLREFAKQSDNFYGISSLGLGGHRFKVSLSDDVVTWITRSIDTWVREKRTP